jgi:hypothetical protein
MQSIEVSVRASSIEQDRCSSYVIFVSFNTAHVRTAAEHRGMGESIFMTLGGNYVIKDGKLSISQCIYLEPIAEKRAAIESEISRWELEKIFELKGQKPHLGVSCPILRDLVDAVGTSIRGHNGHIFIMDLREKVR